MAILQLDILGSPNIGAYCTTTDKYCFIPFGLTEKKITQIHDSLSVSINPITISGSILNGILIAANSNGVVVPHTVRDEEIKNLKKLKDINISILHSRYTALGNMILTNDKDAYDWFKIARYEGRHTDVPYAEDTFDMIGWNMYMPPEQAAYGIALFNQLPDYNEDCGSSEIYHDISIFDVYRKGLTQ